MKVLAFDVGVKHLAYCLLTDAFQIEDWEVLELEGRTIEDHIVSLLAALRHQNRQQLLGADTVVIERQVKANPRMSCIASALLMYFLQAGRPACYVEASKKLGAFKDVLLHAKPGSLPEKGYRRTKAQSVMCTRFVVQGAWRDWFEALPKKDDAADALSLAWSYMKDAPVQL